MPTSVHSSTWSVPKPSARSGGTWQAALVWVHSGGTWHQVSAITFDIDSSFAISSVSGLPSGLTITQCSKSGSTSVLSISGFASDPGQGWFHNIAVANGGLSSATSSATYSYVSGVATWTWSVNLFGATPTSHLITLS